MTLTVHPFSVADRTRVQSRTLVLLWTAQILSGLGTAVSGLFAVLVPSGALVGVGNAVNLQARFAATDLSKPPHRGRDLSVAVWMSTVGAVAGTTTMTQVRPGF